MACMCEQMKLQKQYMSQSNSFKLVLAQNWKPRLVFFSWNLRNFFFSFDSFFIRFTSSITALASLTKSSSRRQDRSLEKADKHNDARVKYDYARGIFISSCLLLASGTHNFSTRTPDFQKLKHAKALRFAASSAFLRPWGNDLPDSWGLSLHPSPDSHNLSSRPITSGSFQAADSKACSAKSETKRRRSRPYLPSSSFTLDTFTHALIDANGDLY